MRIPLFAALLFAALTVTPVTHADTYPARPIRMLIPLAAGSAVDIVARLVAVKMSESLGGRFTSRTRPARRA
ncbi:MAG: hypothetical protein WDN04_03885 [Rhodospirillales bacterium]